MARLISPDPKGIDYIIIQVNGDSGLASGLYHCAPFTLAKIVFLFHKYSARIYLLYVLKSTG